MTPEKDVSDLGNEMLRPPLNRAMRVLDRSLFRKTIPAIAAVIQDPQKISKFKSDLRRDTLSIDRMQTVRVLKDAHGLPTGQKALTLRAGIDPDDASTWSPNLKALVSTSQVHLEPLEIDLDYDYWNYADIISSILPPELQDDIPQGYSMVGHIAHFNLREQFLPYKYLVATVLMDKHPNIRTVINKIENVGVSNPYRTFEYELLAGEDDMNVETSEESCLFRFDYSKVYWNSRLNTEHARLVESFAPGEAVADVMAGVGPFAVPAGKKGCFVYANDLNPASYTCLDDAISRNKVSPYVQAYNIDGLAFIHSATEDLFETAHTVETTRYAKVSRRDRSTKPAPAASPAPQRTYLHRPKIFAHYVLNLPATATSFLPAFIGLHASRREFFAANPGVKMPMIHVYCFSTKSEDNVREGKEICEEISRQLGCEMKPVIVSSAGATASTAAAATATGGSNGGASIRDKNREESKDEENKVHIHNVRDVAPLKRMFCASFRLPARVAFAGS